MDNPASLWVRGCEALRRLWAAPPRLRAARGVRAGGAAPLTAGRTPQGAAARANVPSSAWRWAPLKFRTRHETRSHGLYLGLGLMLQL